MSSRSPPQDPYQVVSELLDNFGYQLDIRQSRCHHLLQTLITFLIWVDFIYYLLVSVLIADDQVWLLLNLGDIGMNAAGSKTRGICNVLFAAYRLNFLIQQTTFYF